MWPFPVMHWTLPYRDPLTFVQGPPGHGPRPHLCTEIPPTSPGPPPENMDMFKFVQYGPHCTRTPPPTCLTFSLWSTCVVRLASHWNAFLLKRVNWSCWSEFKKIQSHHHILVMICNCSHSLDLLCCAWVSNLARIPGNLSKIWNHGKTSLCICACVRVT